MLIALTTVELLLTKDDGVSFSSLGLCHQFTTDKLSSLFTLRRYCSPVWLGPSLVSISYHPATYRLVYLQQILPWLILTPESPGKSWN